MRIKCQFFAVFRDVLGRDELELEVPKGVTVDQLVERVRSLDGGSDLPPRLSVAVNLDYVRGGHRLEDGDEVAFIPPVAGG